MVSIHSAATNHLASSWVIRSIFVDSMVSTAVGGGSRDICVDGIVCLISLF